MAGDWIKIELVTPSKPEVARLAAAWGVERRAALGACVEFWCWASANCTNGALKDVDESVLDAIMFRGFTAAMLQVGWLERKGDTLRIPRFDSHLAGSAKERAAAQRRQQKRRAEASVASRSGHGDVTPVSRSRHGPSATTEQSRAEQSKRREDISALPQGSARAQESFALPALPKALPKALPDPTPGETVADLCDWLGITDPSRQALVGSECKPEDIRREYALACEDKSAGKVRRVVPVMLGMLKRRFGIQLSPRKELMRKVTAARAAKWGSGAA